MLAGLAMGAFGYRSRKDPLLLLVTLLAVAGLFLTTPYVGYQPYSPIWRGHPARTCDQTSRSGRASTRNIALSATDRTAGETDRQPPR